MEEKCNGCGMCLKVCPHEVFDLRTGKAHILNRGLLHGVVAPCSSSIVPMQAIFC